MRIALFTHSLLSDWNHGNAHFLRGLATELSLGGHQVTCFEPHDAWSLQNLLAEPPRDEAPLEAVRRIYPALDLRRYRMETLELDRELDGMDLVIVHEWNEPELVARLGTQRRRHLLLFHDTHHRSVTRPDEMARYSLGGYDGVLAFGRVIADLYLERRWARRAFVFHEAADVRVFRPLPAGREGDLVWIGNWGDDERTSELEEFLFAPVRALGLTGSIHGVRYPDEAREAVRRSGLVYRGWLPNFEVPHTFARHRVTVHVPRRPYAEALPGIPTIRPFEAMACGVPLVCAPWRDSEELFRRGDYLTARDGAEMTRHLRMLLSEPEQAASLAAAGRQTILSRHTCGHRAAELLQIVESLR
jgi:spore maturation protein CgeB